MREHIDSAGMARAGQDDLVCGYQPQHKSWVTDPDGVRSGIGWPNWAGRRRSRHGWHANRPGCRQRMPTGHQPFLRHPDLERSEAPRIGGRPGPYGSGPWPERPVSEANRSGYDHPATRLAADQSALALRSRHRTLHGTAGPHHRLTDSWPIAVVAIWRLSPLCRSSQPDEKIEHGADASRAAGRSSQEAGVPASWSLPSSTSYTKPHMWSLCGRNGEERRRRIDSATSS